MSKFKFMKKSVSFLLSAAMVITGAMSQINVKALEPVETPTGTVSQNITEPKYSTNDTANLGHDINIPPNLHGEIPNYAENKVNNASPQSDTAVIQLSEDEQEVNSIIKDNTVYSTLNSEQKSTLCEYFSVTNSMMLQAEMDGYGLSQSIYMVQTALKNNITLAKANQLITYLAENNDKDMHFLDEYRKQFNISDVRISEILNLCFKGTQLMI